MNCHDLRECDRGSEFALINNAMRWNVLKCNVKHFLIVTGRPLSVQDDQLSVGPRSKFTVRKRLNFNVASSRSGYRGTDVSLDHGAGLVPSKIRWEHLIHVTPRSGKYQHHYIYPGTPNALVLVRFNHQQVLLQPRSAKHANLKISALTDRDEDTPCGTAAYVPQQPLEHGENDGGKGYAKACLLMPGLAKSFKRQVSSADERGSLDDLAYHSHIFSKRLQSPAAMYSEGFNTPGEKDTPGTRGSPQGKVQGKYKPFQTIRPSGDVISDLATTTVTPSSPPQYTQTTVPLPHSFYQVSPSGTTGPHNVTAPLTEDEKATFAVTLQQREGNDTVSLEYDQLTNEPVTIGDPPQDGHTESLLNADRKATATPSPRWDVTGALASSPPVLML